jgi:uncharacterized protein YecE (DUF72 family)
VIRVGTAGFAYKDWEGVVYPVPHPPRFHPLRYLATFFPCVEMNTTFYGVPTPERVAQWVEAVRDVEGFRFTFKLYRGLTHHQDDASLGPFLDALRPCRDAGFLGAILLQFPHFFANVEGSRRRLAFLAEGLAGWPCAVELRHDSWLIEPALDLLRRLGLSFCNIDICEASHSVPPGTWRTGPIGYVRLHGRNAQAWFDRDATVNEKYDYLYSTDELEDWARRVRKIAAETDSTYVVTNNHYGGQAVANAFQLARALDARPTAPPPQLVARFPEIAWPRP